MALISFRVTSAGESQDVDILPVVIVAAERHFGEGMGRLFGADARFEVMCWVSWKALCVTGRESRDFDAWLSEVENVGPTDEDDAAPLDQA